MEDYLLSMAISILLTTIKASFKNAKAKASLRSAFLKIRNAINLLYINDADFFPQEAVLTADGPIAPLKTPKQIAEQMKADAATAAAADAAAQETGFGPGEAPTAKSHPQV
jgi:DNA-binding SARP family transcriptional activator